MVRFHHAAAPGYIINMNLTMALTFAVLGNAACSLHIHEFWLSDAAYLSPVPAILCGSQSVCAGGKRSREVARVVPEMGMALLHRHGKDCLEHEALPVQRGAKYILRSDVAFSTDSE